MSTKTDNRRLWLAGPEPAAQSIPILAFPHAGGGAAAFRQWSRIAPRSFSVSPIQLPGRESRSGEALLDDPDVLIDAVIEGVGALLERPFVLLGHSLGARVSLKLALELKRRGLRQPELLVAAAGAPPAQVSGGWQRGKWSDTQLARYVQELGGTPDEVWSDPELRELVLPRFRADFALFDAMEGNTPGAIDCPIIAIMGNRDEGITAAAMAQWADRTNASFSLHVMDGDHFFPKDLDCAADIMQLAARAIATSTLSSAG